MSSRGFRFGLLVLMTTMFASPARAAGSSPNSELASLPVHEPMRIIDLPAGLEIETTAAMRDEARIYLYGEQMHLDLLTLANLYWREIGAALLAAMALMTIVPLWRTVRRRRNAGQPYCRHCNYCLTGVASASCPECGRDTMGRGRVVGRRIRRRVATLTCMILASLIASIWLGWFSQPQSTTAVASPFSTPSPQPVAGDYQLVRMEPKWNTPIRFWHSTKALGYANHIKRHSENLYDLANVLVSVDLRTSHFSPALHCSTIEKPMWWCFGKPKSPFAVTDTSIWVHDGEDLFILGTDSNTSMVVHDGDHQPGDLTYSLSGDQAYLFRASRLDGVQAFDLSDPRRCITFDLTAYQGSFEEPASLWVVPEQSYVHLMTERGVLRLDPATREPIPDVALDRDRYVFTHLWMTSGDLREYPLALELVTELNGHEEQLIDELAIALVGKGSNFISVKYPGGQRFIAAPDGLPVRRISTDWQGRFIFAEIYLPDQGVCLAVYDMQRHAWIARLKTSDVRIILTDPHTADHDRLLVAAVQNNKTYKHQLYVYDLEALK